MTSPRRCGCWRVAGPCALLLIGPAPALADTPEARAAAILSAAAAATGGEAWDKLKELHLTLHRQAGDDTVDEEIWIDPHQGELLLAIADGADAGRSGFDGRTAWHSDTEGTTRPLKDAERADALAEAFWRSAGWTRPVRAPASAVWLREEGQGSHIRDVVRITAPGASPVEITFDRASHLPVRLALHAAAGDETVQLSQWRRTDGASLPWRVDIVAGQARIVETVATAVGSSAIDPARYAPPTGPAIDYVFPGEAMSAELPIRLVNGHVHLEAHIGKARLHMILETGATGAIDRDAVHRLGLAVHPAPGSDGTVRIPELGIGGVTLKHQTMPVQDLSGLASLEGVAIDGILGLELARRLVVELDYEGRRLVLLRPDGFVSPPSATPVPIGLAGRLPTIVARIDGILATLAIDTATPEGLVLRPEFATAHGLAEKWHAVPALVSVGAVPPVLGSIGRAASLEIGVFGVAQPAVWIAAGPPAGVDGVVGNGLLRRYDTILDYRHGRLWLQPNRSAAAPEAGDVAGLTIEQRQIGLVITAILPHGPADRAGLKQGDVIELVGGEPAAALGLPEIRTRLAGPSGGAVSLRVKRDGDSESYRILLADPLAPAEPE